MKEILIQFATYNIWATKKLTNKILLLSKEQQECTIESSFTSLRLTLFHMLDAESIWWQRLKLAEHLIIPSNNTLKTTPDIIEELKEMNLKWLEWIEKANMNQIEFVFAYQNSKKEQFKQPVWQMLLHVFNHATYHRGQLVTILRQLKEEKVPSTDFIEWSRKK
jgi:uncharacterized damage-inducible protein DinB